MQATLCPPRAGGGTGSMRLVGGASRRAAGTERPAHHHRTDRHRLGGGGELRDGERRGHAGEPGGVGPPLGRCGDPRICSRSTGCRSTSPQKTLPIAQQRGSNLLGQIVTTLQDGHKFPGAPNVAEPVRSAILIGHEANIAHVERLLNLGWQVPGLPGQRGIARQRARLRAVPRGLDGPALRAAGPFRPDARTDAPGDRSQPCRAAGRRWRSTCRPAPPMRTSSPARWSASSRSPTAAIDPGCVTIRP